MGKKIMSFFTPPKAKSKKIITTLTLYAVHSTESSINVSSPVDTVVAHALQKARDKNDVTPCIS